VYLLEGKKSMWERAGLGFVIKKIFVKIDYGNLNK
jgi:hypothetical protein